MEQNQIVPQNHGLNTRKFIHSIECSLNHEYVCDFDWFLLRPHSLFSFQFKISRMIVYAMRNSFQSPKSVLSRLWSLRRELIWSDSTVRLSGDYVVSISIRCSSVSTLSYREKRNFLRLVLMCILIWRNCRAVDVLVVRVFKRRERRTKHYLYAVFIFMCCATRQIPVISWNAQCKRLRKEKEEIK